VNYLDIKHPVVECSHVVDVGKTFHLEGMHFFHTKLAKYWQDLHVCKGSFPQVNGVLLMPKCQNVTSSSQISNSNRLKTKNQLIKLFLYIFGVVATRKNIYKAASCSFWYLVTD
jgi:hypothetical protein